jgi:uncharacterized protein (DUF697 family)
LAEPQEPSADSTDETPKTPPSAKEIEAIIRHRVYASMGIGLLPLPVIDLAALTTIQMEMIYRLGKRYGYTFNRDWLRKSISFLLGSLTPVLLADGFSGLLGYIPLIGSALSPLAGTISFGAATYVVGIAFNRRFASGKIVDKKDLEKMGEEVKSGFASAKDKVKGWISRSKDKVAKDAEAVEKEAKAAESSDPEPQTT